MTIGISYQAHFMIMWLLYDRSDTFDKWHLRFIFWPKKSIMQNKWCNGIVYGRVIDVNPTRSKSKVVNNIMLHFCPYTIEFLSYDEYILWKMTNE